MIRPARWRKRQREGGASLFILVQIQAGSPAFAAPQPRLGKPEHARRLPRRSSNSEGGPDLERRPAVYLGFAIGGALGGAVLATLSPSDLGWMGGTSVAAALLVHLARGWQARPKPLKIAG